MTIESIAPASVPTPTNDLDETRARRCPLGLDRHEIAWRRIAPYEGGQRRLTTTDFTRRNIEEEGAWTQAFGVRLGDLAPGALYCIKQEWCRRIEPPVLECYGRAVGRPGTRPNQQALVPASPWRVVRTDKALAYLKAVPHGARFRLTNRDPWYVKSETDFVSRTIVARREEDGTPVALPPNVVVELDPSEVDS